MALMEELMGLFGGGEARGAQGLGGTLEDDPRRRRAGQPSGYDGIAGGNVSLMDIMPHLQGLRAYDYSGPNIRGLRDLLPAMDQITGPARRHLERQGGPEQLPFNLPPGLADRPDLPPGVDSRNAIGGPNVAPGNVDTGLALGQPPGIPAHAMGAARAMPHTQGWRNVAPGGAVFAGLGYGTPEFEGRLQGLGLGGRPSAIAGGAGEAQVKPGLGGGQAVGGGGAGKSVGGGGQAGPAAVKAGGPAVAASGGGGRGEGGGAGKPGAPASSGSGTKPAGPGGKGGPKLKGSGPANKPSQVVGKGPGKPVSELSSTSKKGAKKGPGLKGQPSGPVPKGTTSTATTTVGKGAGAPTPAPAPKPIQKTAPQQPVSKSAGPSPAPVGKTKPKGGAKVVGGVFK